MELIASHYCGRLLLILLGGSPMAVATLSVCCLVLVSFPITWKEWLSQTARQTCVLQLQLPYSHQQQALTQFIRQIFKSIFLYIQSSQAKGECIFRLLHRPLPNFWPATTRASYECSCKWLGYSLIWSIYYLFGLVLLPMIGCLVFNLFSPNGYFDSHAIKQRILLD